MEQERATPCSDQALVGYVLGRIETKLDTLMRKVDRLLISGRGGLSLREEQAVAASLQESRTALADAVKANTPPQGT
jgi:hypothetical protein